MAEAASKNDQEITVLDAEMIDMNVLNNIQQELIKAEQLANPGIQYETVELSSSVDSDNVVRTLIRIKKKNTPSRLCFDKCFIILFFFIGH